MARGNQRMSSCFSCQLRMQKMVWVIFSDFHFDSIGSGSGSGNGFKMQMTNRKSFAIITQIFHSKLQCDEEGMKSWSAWGSLNVNEIHWLASLTTVYQSESTILAKSKLTNQFIVHWRCNKAIKGNRMMEIYWNVHFAFGCDGSTTHSLARSLGPPQWIQCWMHNVFFIELKLAIRLLNFEIAKVIYCLASTKIVYWVFVHIQLNAVQYTWLLNIGIYQMQVCTNINSFNYIANGRGFEWEFIFVCKMVVNSKNRVNFVIWWHKQASKSWIFSNKHAVTEENFQFSPFLKWI